MREIVRSNDPVLLSFVTSLLEDAGIGVLVADQNISAIEGSIGAFPRRLMVAEAALGRAAEVLREAGLGHVVVGANPSRAPRPAT